MREGRRPDGANLFPAFPYPSFTRMSDGDLRDLWAYLRSLPANATPSRPHELGFFYRWRFLVTIWKWLFFTPGPFVPDAAKSALLNRGAYLVQAMGHCGECHTPRNFLGGPKDSRFLGGAKLGETAVPNITPTQLKKVGDGELKDILRTATTSDGDVLAESMSEVVRNTTSQLTEQDLDAMIAYLRSLPALPDEGK
jgi:mono/diheme cytochrome c family protein